jgi:hypothetical protein
VLYVDVCLFVFGAPMTTAVQVELLILAGLACEHHWFHNRMVYILLRS